jgi:hypothetical protein
MKRVLLCVLLLVGASPPALRKTSDLDSVRSILARAKWADLITLPPPMALKDIGPTEHLELSLGAAFTLVLIREPHRTQSLLFDQPSGRFLHGEASPEINSVALADLDGDGVQEVLVDRTDGWGTGVLERRFHLFRVSRSGWKELWSGVGRSTNYLGGTEGAVALGAPTYSSLTYFVSETSAGQSKLRATCLTLKRGRMTPCAER